MRCRLKRLEIRSSKDYYQLNKLGVIIKPPYCMTCSIESLWLNRVRVKARYWAKDKLRKSGFDKPLKRGKSVINCVLCKKEIFKGGGKLYCSDCKNIKKKEWAKTGRNNKPKILFFCKLK